MTLSQFGQAMGFAACWKTIGPYLCFFFATQQAAMFGIVLAPVQYVMRTGDSIWQAYEVPDDVRQAMNDLLQLQERWKIIQQTAEDKGEYEKLMGMSDIKIKAKALGIDGGKMKKTELIHAIQKAEGCNPCYGRSNGSCPWTQCCWRADCLKN